ncbi:unnamed protein product [Prunus armeniaca]
MARNRVWKIGGSCKGGGEERFASCGVGFGGRTATQLLFEIPTSKRRERDVEGRREKTRVGLF